MAVDDLENIAEYIAIDSEYYAADFVKRIIEQVEKLEKFPLLGRKVPEENNQYLREIIYHNYRLVYKLVDDKIYITIISHGSFDLAERFEDV